ncbi:Holliday junction branch migration protein RuvA [Brevibacillus fluminis]|uniref:Holliday junction branch migration complex subunit RuvA n=1 Tax=Brevibacillus fluminis TaxID=511487 RepID=A0A3M8DR29_9BACL|nr:Holliday junction branch migration protein RuvA [Brevibacillus fluminis]RNB90596.1 Holliday junction branch migration protein RuvA [Brevibacillus fluminis]
MIDFVEGTLVYLESEFVVVETGGIGYRLFSPNPYAFIQNQGMKLRFFTHHHVREDAMHLYGFATRDERDLYRKLLEVTGIGPKGALTIMGAATPEEIVRAVQQENVAYLTKFPGIGKKTAQRMILDLKDKLAGYTPSMVLPVDGVAAAAAHNAHSILTEALEALTALGYTDMEILKIKSELAAQAEAGADVERLIKLGLAQLMRG